MVFVVVNGDFFVLMLSLTVYSWKCLYLWMYYWAFHTFSVVFWFDIVIASLISSLTYNSIYLVSEFQMLLHSLNCKNAFILRPQLEHMLTCGKSLLLESSLKTLSWLLLLIQSELLQHFSVLNLLTTLKQLEESKKSGKKKCSEISVGKEKLTNICPLLSINNLYFQHRNCCCGIYLQVTSMTL